MFTWKTTNGFNIKLFKVGITNCYLIRYNKTNILVDSGQKRFRKKIISVLSKNLEENTLHYLLLSHTHYDHSQNVKTISEIYNPKIIVHQSEAECLSKGYTPIPDGTMFFTKIVANLGRRFTPKLAAYDKVNADITIDSDYLIENNPGLRIIETPGHTKGSVSLIIDNEIAVVGDTMFGHFKRTIMTPFGNDIPTMIESWQKLLETNCRLFLPAHGKAIKKEQLEKELKKEKV